MRRVDSQRQGGFTLVELLVGMLILGIVMTALVASFTTATQSSAASDNRIQNLEEARILMANVSKDLRTATPITGPGATPFVPTTGGLVLAGDRDVTFYASLYTSGAPRRVRLWVDTSNPNEPVLRETVRQPDSETPPLTYNTKPDKTRLVGRYIVNGSTFADAVLSYYNGAGARLTTPLTTADAEDVRSIRVRLKVRRSTNLAVRGSTLETTVRLVNVLYACASGCS